MTDLEAIEHLQERARAFARPLHIASGFATLGVGIVGAGVMVLLQWAAAGVAEIKISVLGGCAGASVVPFGFNRFIKLMLQRRRTEWINEMVHGEGASREALEASFSFDSW
ncbi:MAG: hypothetical protein Q8N23_21470 [Archangium sp.]|nr:hypothetical protein [Archangium sp.]MDP3155263.1 hypothetical protein [Archangium sp.]MDP3570924.1 hypothetical protein [Archangium sp.]